MKNAIALFLPLVLLFAACSGVETHRAAIESLSSEWDNTTNEVMDFANSLQQEQTNFHQELSEVAPEEDALNTVKEDQQALLTDAYNSLQSSGSVYNNLTNEVNEFLATWTEKSNEITALKEGLNEGQLPKNVTEQITNLNTFAAEATSKLSGWQEQLDAARSEVAAKMSTYETVVAEVLPNK